MALQAPAIVQRNQCDSLELTDLAMILFQSGDLVVLKSGGPTMTVDAVNTNIFDDDKITGICVWFVGEKLEKVRFDHRAPGNAHNTSNAEEPSLEATGEYKMVLE